MSTKPSIACPRGHRYRRQAVEGAGVKRYEVKEVEQ